MYFDRDLDSPPPRSQFRRPWSPEPHDLQPSSSNPRNQPQYSNHNFGDHGQEPSLSYAIPPMRRQREPSEVSVEALDLADYAKTLRARQAEDPYPPFPSQLQHQASTNPSLPRAPPQASSRDSLAIHPPSLVSRGPTISSSMTHDTLATRLSDYPPNASSSSHPSSGGRRPGRRPFSLPGTPTHASHHYPTPRAHPPSSFPNRGPHIVDPNDYPPPPSSQEIDISNFPRWSRHWYNNPNSGSTRQHGIADHPMGDEFYTPLPPPATNRLDSWNSVQRKSIFDPEYHQDTYNSYDPPPPLSSIGHESSRNLLPWSNDPPAYGTPVDPQVKAERLRLLEREFGGQGKTKSNTNGRLVDDEGKPLVGTVDQKGALVTSGPKRRIAARLLQLTFALAAAIPGIYAAIAIKPSNPRSPPPPANKPPAYVLYVVSSLTFVALVYLFVIHPCCCTRSRSKSAKHPLHPANMGMMVLPVGGLPGAKKGKPNKGKKGKYGKHGPSQGDVQVNLIVDPSAFNPPDQDEDEEEEDGYDSHDGSMPGAFGSNSSNSRRKKRNANARRRRGLFEGLAMEEEWKRARSWVKKLTFVDIGGALVWGAVFIFVMIGERCPTGTHDGWCNAYNVSTAAACLLCVTFVFSIFFDVQDLHASKQSPRTRT